MRDEKGRFKKSFFNKKNMLAFKEVLAALFFLVLAIGYYVSVVNLKELKKEAYENGYATYVDSKFTWIEIRRAIIP
jgi:hypothetical protein